MEKNRLKKRSWGVRIPFKASLWYTASGFITKLIGLISTPIFTRLMSEEEYALFPLFLSFIAVLAPICAQDASTTATLGGLQHFEGKREEFLKAAMGFGAASVFAVFVAFSIVFPFISGLSALPDISLVGLIFLQLFCDAINHVFLAGGRYSYRYVPVFFYTIASSALSFSLSLILLRYTSLGGIGRVFGLLIPSAVFAAISLWRAAKKSGRFFSAEAWRYLIKTSLPLIPINTLGALLSTADRLMISSFYGRAAFAKYSVAHSLGAAISFISAALGLAMRPWILRKLAAGCGERAKRAADAAVPILCALALFSVAVSPELMMILAPSGYSEALFAVSPIALSIIPSFLSGVLSIRAAYAGRCGRTVLPTLICAVGSIAANAFLMRRFPYTAASLSSLVFSVIAMLLNFAICKRQIGEPFSPRRAIFFLSLSFAIGFFLIYMRDFPLLRTIWAAILLLLSLPFCKVGYELIKEKDCRV